MFDKINLGDLFDFVDTSTIKPALDALISLNKEYSALSRNLLSNSKKIAKASDEVTKAILANEAALKNLNVTTQAGRQQIVSVTVAVGAQVKAHQQHTASLKAVKQVQQDVKGSLNELTQRLKEQRAEFAKLSAEQSQDIPKMFQLANAINATATDMVQLRQAARGVNSEFSAAGGSYNQLENQTKQLVARLKALGGGMDLTTQDAKDLQKQIEENTAKLKAFDASIGRSFREVGNYAQGILGAVDALKKQKKELLEEREALVNAQRATKGNTDEQDRLQKELTETNQKLAQVNQQLKSYGANTEEVSKKQGVLERNFRSFVTSTALAYFSLQALQQVLGEVFRANVEFSDALIAVQKTTGLAGAEINEFVDALKAIPTRTSLSGLLEIAKVGGQLGIAKKDILGFTSSVDVAVQALSDDFEGGAEVIANSLGKINSIFKVSENVGIDQALLDIGSAINELAASGVSTAPFLTDYARRVGAIASNAGLALGPVLAMGAALEELGFTSEVAGTASNRLISGLATKPKEFYAIAKLAQGNLTLKEFKNLINTDFKGALDLFLAGLNKGGTSTTSFAALIKSLGLRSGEAVSVLTSLARNVDLVDERLVLANKELEHGTSLAKEAALRTDNLAGSYEQLKNKLVNLVTTPGVTGFFKDLIDFAKGGFLGGDPGKPVRDVAKELVTAGIAAKDTASEGRALLFELKDINKALNEPLSGDKREQLIKDEQVAIQKLIALYGDGIATLNVQTGAYELNEKAARSAANKSQEAFSKSQIAISKELKKTNEEIRIQEALQKAAPKVQEARISISKQIGLSVEDVKLIQDYNIAKEKFDKRNVVAEAVKNPTIFGPMGFDIGGGEPKRPDGVTDQMIAVVRGLDAAQTANNATGVKMAELLAKETLLRKNLAKVGLDYSTAMWLANQQNKDAIKTAEDLAEQEGKEAKAKHDLAHAQYELNKAMAEARLAEYERQFANVANTEDVRNKALTKATKERVYIAQLDKNEGVRLSKERNKEIINGQAIFNTESATLSVQLNAALKKIGHDRLKDEIELQNKLRDAAGNVDKLILEREIAGLKQVEDNELLSYEERTKAAKEAADKRIRIAELERDAKIRAARGEKFAIMAAEEEFKTKKKDILDPKKDVKPFDSAKANDTSEQMKLERLIELEEKIAEKRKSTRAVDLDDVRAYEAEKYRIEQEFANQQLGNEELELGKTKSVLDKKLQMYRDNNARTLEQQKAHFEKMGELIQMALQETQVLFDGYADIASQKRDNELEQMTRQKDNELEIAGDNEKAKSKINNEYDAKARKIKREQAKADKAQAMFNVAMNTAMAITSVLSTGGGTRYADFGISAGILTAIVAAQGAIQLGLIAAKPLPAYFKGTKNSVGGPALVGERGAELIEKNGKFSYVDKPSIVNLEKGSTVHNAADTKRMIQNLESKNLTTEVANSYIAGAQAITVQQRTVNAATSPQELAAALSPEFRTIARAIENQEQVAINFTKEGIEFQVRKAQQWTTYENHKYYRGRKS